LRATGAFAKFDVEGDFCLIAIKDDHLRALNKRGSNHYGGGLLGLMLNESAKDKIRWNDNNMDLYSLILINTTLVDGIHNSVGVELKRKKLNKLLHTDCNHIELESRIEDVIEILNQKIMDNKFSVLNFVQ